MKKLYYEIGKLYGCPILVEVEEVNAEHTKAMVNQYIKANGLPRYINANPDIESAEFERTFPQHDLKWLKRK